MDRKRKFTRLRTDIEVEWKEIKNGKESASTFTNLTKDISAGGICLLASELLVRGTLLALNIKLPEQNIKAKGIIKWSYASDLSGNLGDKKYETGIEFTQISETDKDFIDEFIFTSSEEFE